MELKEFVKKVLLDLTEAVEDASREATREIEIYATQNNRAIEFDIAVSVEEASKKSGKAGVKVLQFAEAGGDMSVENINSSVSRIKFGVSVSGFTKEEQQRRDEAFKKINQRSKQRNSEFI